MLKSVVKSIILKLFPELSAGLHVDRYARVVAIADPPSSEAEEGASSERFRPRYAVDLEILTPELEPDPAYPIYPAVPLPVPLALGLESGLYAFPAPGSLAVVSFAYGRPDHPLVRQLYPLGWSLPALAPGEILIQQNAQTMQRADAAGNWQRQAAQGIAEKSLTRARSAVESLESYAREARKISENSHTEVQGVSDLEAGLINLLAVLKADIGALGEVNLTAGGASTFSTAGQHTETVGQDHQSTIKGSRMAAVIGADVLEVGADQQATIGGSRTDDITGDQKTTVGGSSDETATGAMTKKAASLAFTSGSSISFTSLQGGGSGGMSLFAELLAALDAIHAALIVISTHGHPAPDAPPSQGAAIAADAADLKTHRNNLGGITR